MLITSKWKLIKNKLHFLIQDQVDNTDIRYTHFVMLSQCWELVRRKCGAIMKIEADLSQNRW
jgi:hypothetical protein